MQGNGLGGIGVVAAHRDRDLHKQDIRISAWCQSGAGTGATPRLGVGSLTRRRLRSIMQTRADSSMAEQAAHNRPVPGSSPGRPTISDKRQNLFRKFELVY